MFSAHRPSFGGAKARQPRVAGPTTSVPPTRPVSAAATAWPIGKAKPPTPPGPVPAARPSPARAPAGIPAPSVPPLTLPPPMIDPTTLQSAKPAGATSKPLTRPSSRGRGVTPRGSVLAEPAPGIRPPDLAQAGAPKVTPPLRPRPSSASPSPGPPRPTSASRSPGGASSGSSPAFGGRARAKAQEAAAAASRESSPDEQVACPICHQYGHLPADCPKGRGKGGKRR